VTIMQFIVDLIKAAAWPAVAVFALIRYREVLIKLARQTKIKFSFANVDMEVTLAELETSVEESLRGHPLVAEQWDWLRRLRDQGPTMYEPVYYLDLRPLRNSGLIREYPEGWLSNANWIEITTLGRLLLRAKEEQNRGSATVATRPSTR
jgi:hypothetical protein